MNNGLDCSRNEKGSAAFLKHEPKTAVAAMDDVGNVMIVRAFVV
jgi:hypothetical protein